MAHLSVGNNNYLSGKTVPESIAQSSTQYSFTAAR